MFRRRTSPRRVTPTDTGPDFSLSILLTLLAIILWGIAQATVGGAGGVG